jgi:hypothetical protein
MNYRKLNFALISIVVLILAFSSCTKEGPSGPTGANGATGASGATGTTGATGATGQSSNPLETTVFLTNIPITTAQGSYYVYNNSTSFPALTQTVFDSGTVDIYYQNPTNISVWYQVPYYASPTNYINASYSVGSITIASGTSYPSANIKVVMTAPH